MKFGPTQEDFEDHAQEKMIQAWLKEKKSEIYFEFQSFTPTGTAKRQAIRAHFSLDQNIKDGEVGDFHGLIKGSDGMDLVIVDPDPEPGDIIHTYLVQLLKVEDLVAWVEKTLRSWIAKNERLFQTSPTDSEW